jgi:hypothetical protein
MLPELSEDDPSAIFGAGIRKGVRLSVRAQRQKAVLPGNQIVAPCEPQGAGEMLAEATACRRTEFCREFNCT